jgi:ABC-type uncharacterized transport system substrate-binding protein
VTASGSVFTVILTVALLATPVAGQAQATDGVVRLGVLATTRSPLLEGFRQELRAYGHVEGSTLAIEWRFTQGKLDRLPAFVADLVALKVALIVAPSNAAAHAARSATEAIPIVMAGVGDAVEEGLVQSLARPGGNVTGVSVPYPALAAKQVELLKVAVPRLTRVAVLWNPGATWRPDHVRRIEDAVRPLGVRLQSVEVVAPGDLDTVFARMRRENADGLLVLPDSMVFAHRERIAALARQHRLPMISALAEFAHAGGLLTYAPSLADLWRKAAFYADRILRGTKPADLPVEQPTKFELIINLKTARTLGLTIPQAVLIRADDVLQ